MSRELRMVRLWYPDLKWQELSDFAPPCSTQRKAGEACDTLLSISPLPTACFQWSHMGQASRLCSVNQSPLGTLVTRHKGRRRERLLVECSNLQNFFWKNLWGSCSLLHPPHSKFIYQFLYHPSNHPSTCLSVHPSIPSFIHSSILPTTDLLIFLHICLFIYLQLQRQILP